MKKRFAARYNRLFCPDTVIFVKMTALAASCVDCSFLSFPVKDFLLFIDTEASGLPKKWDAPYSKEGVWPHAVQVSWIIYTSGGQKIKEENHYISDNDFVITAASVKIHGLTAGFLSTQGEPRKKVMQLLADDLHFYQPLVVGHFVELDKHITGAEFYRTGIANPMNELPAFCTMLATTFLIRNPQQKYLRLGDLYNLLFNEEQPGQHNALADALATARCYFALRQRGDINDEKIVQQQANSPGGSNDTRKSAWGMLVLAICLLIALIVYYI